MLPLDLHVLSLSLAFILSQDQTLRCIYIVLFFFSVTRLERHQNNGTACPRPGFIAAGPRQETRRVFLSPVFRNLDRENRGMAFLVSLLLVNFLIANISMISCLTPFGKGVKKTAQLGQRPREPKSVAKVRRLFGTRKLFTNFFSKKMSFFALSGVSDTLRAERDTGKPPLGLPPTFFRRLMTIKNNFLRYRKHSHSALGH